MNGPCFGSAAHHLAISAEGDVKNLGLVSASTQIRDLDFVSHAENTNDGTLFGSGGQQRSVVVESHARDRSVVGIDNGDVGESQGIVDIDLS